MMNRRTFLQAAAVGVGSATILPKLQALTQSAGSGFELLRLGCGGYALRGPRRGVIGVGDLVGITNGAFEALRDSSAVGLIGICYELQGPQTLVLVAGAYPTMSHPVAVL